MIRTYTLPIQLFFLLQTVWSPVTMAQVNFKEAPVEKSSKDFLIPRKLTQIIEQNYLQHQKQTNPKLVVSDDELLSRIPREYLEVIFYLRSSAPGVLKHHTSYALPRGGGEIDLQHAVEGEKGSFYLTIEAYRPGEMNKKLNHLNIYYLSQTKKTKIDGEDYGSGCDVYMDVTSIFVKNEEGLRLNAKDRRYLPVVGGTFYFVHYGDDRKIYIAAVRVKDSRYPEMFCDNEF